MDDVEELLNVGRRKMVRQREFAAKKVVVRMVFVVGNHRREHR